MFSGMDGKIVLLDLDELEAKCYIKICMPQEACEHRSFVEMYYIYYIYRLGLALHLDSQVFTLGKSNMMTDLIAGTV